MDDEVNFFDKKGKPKAAPQEAWPEEPPLPNGEDDYGDNVVHLRQQKPQAPLQATPLSALDLDHIPPRPWLYGRELIRGFVSVLASPGGVGKTSYTMVAAISVAINYPFLARNPDMPGYACTVHKDGSVWLYNLEDPIDELKRRMKAALIHHKVDYADVADRIYMDSGRDKPLIVATRTRSGDLIAAPVVDELVRELQARNILLLIVDPFVQSHNAEENRNEEMNLVMALWGRVANEANCAVWLVHHFRKGGKGGDAEAVRGAGAIQGAARSMHTISVMSHEEADKLGVPEDERWQYVRHDNVKSNMAPPATVANWFKLINVPLGNGTDEYPDGDHVQTIEAWEPPSLWGDMPWSLIERILNRINDGPSPGEFYAAGKQAKDRWAGKVIVEEACKTDSQAATMLKTWRENGLLTDEQYASPRLKGGMTGCVRVNQTKFSEMRLTLSRREGPFD